MTASRFTALTTLLPLVLLATATAQTTRRVPSQHPTIAAALAAAAPGDTVLIAPGLYRENDLDPAGKELTIRGERGAASTVLDFQGAGGFLVVNDEGPGLILEGLTLRRGFRASTGVGSGGGALRITGRGAPTVRDCVFQACSGTEGGAIRLVDRAGVTVSATRFERNTDVAVLGDGPGSSRFSDCVFTDNESGMRLVGDSSVTGGTFTLERCQFTHHRVYAAQLFSADVVLRGCSFTDNDCSGEMFAGGSNNPLQPVRLEGCRVADNRCVAVPMRFSGLGPVSIFDSVFEHNRTTNASGCMRIVGVPLNLEDSSFVGNSSATAAGAVRISGRAQPDTPDWWIRRCRFLDNFSAAGPGALQILSSGGPIEDCLFQGNTSLGDHGALDLGLDSTLRNCTVIGNVSIGTIPGNEAAVSHRGGLEVRSCIVWGNQPAQIETAVPTRVVYSDVEGGYAGTGNLAVDPMFVRSTNDYRLSAASPCLEAGEPGSRTGGLDIDGRPRLLGATVDMGCVEGALQPLPGTVEDLELWTWLDESGDPVAPVKAPTAGTRLSVLVRSPQSTFLGATTLIVGDFNPTGMPAPTTPGWPGLHIDLASPSLFVAVNSISFGGPLGGGGLPANGLGFAVTVPPGLTGRSLYLQSAVLDPRAANGTYAASNAHEIRMP